MKPSLARTSRSGQRIDGGGSMDICADLPTVTATDVCPAGALWEYQMTLHSPGVHHAPPAPVPHGVADSGGANADGGAKADGGTKVDGGADAARAAICELCRLFWRLGWASGTGGGIAVRDGERIFMAPSGVEKEKLAPSDIFELDRSGAVVTPPGDGKRLTACAPLFMAAFKHRDAGAVLHSHSLNVVLASALVPSGQPLRLTRLEMMKGLEGVGYFDVHEVPVVDNTALEHELEARMEAAVLAFPKANAVIVRNHGVYIWGRDTSHAKTQAECLDYLCAAVVRMHGAGIDHLTHDHSQP
jgi:methylthioribulose-1-phosphate dehydratase